MKPKVPSGTQGSQHDRRECLAALSTTRLCAPPSIRGNDHDVIFASDQGRGDSQGLAGGTVAPRCSAKKADQNKRELHLHHFDGDVKSSMVKTQIQLPDDLYQRVNQLAKQKEWSLAETLRRGAELLFQQYPPPQSVRQPWTPPKPRRLGWKGWTDAEVHAAALADMEPSIPPGSRR